MNANPTPNYLGAKSNHEIEKLRLCLAEKEAQQRYAESGLAGSMCNGMPERSSALSGEIGQCIGSIQEVIYGAQSEMNRLYSRLEPIIGPMPDKGVNATRPGSMSQLGNLLADMEADLRRLVAQLIMLTDSVVL
jgi:hypothetical protein